MHTSNLALHKVVSAGTNFAEVWFSMFLLAVIGSQGIVSGKTNSRHLYLYSGLCIVLWSSDPFGLISCLTGW